MQETMKAVRQRKPGGTLEVGEVPLPQPGPGEVLIRMEAAPINPSDLSVLKGDPEDAVWPITPGLEGAGTVVKAGPGVLPALRKGQRVACTPGKVGEGTWAEYMKTQATRVVPLPREVDFHQGSMMLVNPMTALAFIRMAGKGGHRAMINNAAGSQLGRMLQILAARYSLPLVNVVRSPERAAELSASGTRYVLDSSQPGFAAELRDLSHKLRATLVFDAVGGAETARLLEAVPAGSTLVVYARLSGEQVRADPVDLIRHGKQVTGFQLGYWLQKKSLLFKLRFSGKVTRHMRKDLEISIRKTVPMDKAGESVHHYWQEAHLGKVLITPGTAMSQTYNTKSDTR